MNKNALFLPFGIAVVCAIIGCKDDVNMPEKVAESPRVVVAKRDGSCVASIMIPKNASAVQKYAAEELRDFTEKITGRRMTIIDDSSPLPSCAVLLGDTRYTAALLNEPQFDARKLGDDGFRIVARPPHLLILGEGMRSSLFGVYGFLEDHAGCEWYSSSYSHIPSNDVLSVAADLDDEQIPAFRWRDSRPWDVIHNPDFAARLRLYGSTSAMVYSEKHGASNIWYVTTCHSLKWLLPAEEFFKSHPEYFSEINGFREPHQPCLSSPDVRRIVKERLMAVIAKHYPRGVRYFPVGQCDNGNYCRCKQCRTLDEREGSSSATMVDFINYIAAAVAEKYPDVKIRMLAYMYTQQPPKTLRLRHNVQVLLCADSADRSRPLLQSRNANSKKLMTALSRWSEIASELRIWDYSINFSLYAQPFPNIQALHKDFAFFRDNGVTDMYEEGCDRSPYATLQAFRLWMIAHLMWKPDQELNPLVNRFMRGYYGAAAPHMRRYYDEMHAIPFQEGVRAVQMWWPASPFDITEEFLESSAVNLRAAAEAVADDPERLRHVKLDVAMNEVMRILRDNVGAPVEVSRNPEYVKGARFAELRAAAQAYLELAKSSPKLMTVGHDRNYCRLWELKVKHLATMDPTKVVAADCAFMSPEVAIYAMSKDRVTLVDDPEATTGKALRLTPKAKLDDLAFFMNCAHFDKGGTYRVRVRAKAKVVPGAKGGVFRCSRKMYKKECLDPRHVSGSTVSVGDVSEQYKWYDMIEPWKPKVTDSICFGCADWDGKKTNFNPNVESIWLDGIELVRVD